MSSQNKTERLILKPISNEDSDFIHNYLSDAERTRYLPLGNSYSSEEADLWIKNRISHWKNYNFGTHLVKERESGKDIGYCGLEYVLDSELVDIRYGLIQESWGKGYAFEAALECVRNGFELLNFEIIYGAAVSENYASIHLLKKIGMLKDEDFNLYGSSVESFSIVKNRFRNLLYSYPE